jgi:hypothetical protein
MRLALWLAAAALPLAGQPKLLVNAQTDARSAAAGLEREFRTLVSAQPQPAWIGYAVPVLRGRSLGCEIVSPGGGSAPGVVHLEPPDRMVVLFRVESSAVGRVRTLSPDCEIDGGGLPFHWLSDVSPAQSVALLAGMATERGESVVSAVALHSDPSADASLERLVAADQPEAVRRRAAFWLGESGGGRRFEMVKSLLASRPGEDIEQRAISGLGASRAPDATGLLISIAREGRTPGLRSQAVSALGRRSGPKVAETIAGLLENDPDAQVRRRAAAALQSLPEGAGVPLLIQVVKRTRNAEVRQQAMASLGGSRDPRAIAFFQEILK